MEEIVDGTSTVLADGLPVPPAHVGPSRRPDYTSLITDAVKTIKTDEGDIMVFAGPTDDPFWVDLGSMFDLLSLRPQAAPIGYEGGPRGGINGLAGFNVHSIAIQVPIDRVLKTAGDNTVVGVWATSSRPSVRVFGPGKSQTIGDLVQVSRLRQPARQRGGAAVGAQRCV